MPHKRRRSHDPELGEVPVSTVRRLDNVTRVISRGLESIGQAARATLYQPPSAVNRTRTAFSISRWMAQVTSSADPEPECDNFFSDIFMFSLTNNHAVSVSFPLSTPLLQPFLASCFLLILHVDQGNRRPVALA
jgi:hypothetical protein